MVIYKYKGKQYNVPSKKEDVNLKQYLDIVALGDGVDYLEVFSILLGDSNLNVNNIEDIEFQALIMAQTQWIGGLINDCNKPIFHKKITFENKKYKLPKSFGEMNLGQRMLISQTLEKYNNDQDYTEFVSTSLAIFFAPSIYGDDWSDEVELMKDILKEHEALQMMQLVNFFLSRQRSITAFGIAALCFRKMRIQTGQMLKGLIGLD